MIFDVMEEEDDSSTKEAECPKPLCYYVMNDGQVTEQNVVFKKPDEEMKRHLKPLYIWAKVEDVGINKVLVDGVLQLI